ncbi:MAG: putative structural protein [Prokaryotic dsDNA virus sp.]|nr:MAG: putative structural protein [Prokaryotic dsDNA virus sp.]|tara:strand:- start:7585 stop:8010 length:426 start_codon:yes stop_codon:yes gene_type:complete
MSFANYDATQVILVFNGAPISGFADGTFITVEFDEQQFNKTTGADGLTQRSKTGNYAGNITVTLLNGSPSNDVLSAAWNADRVSNNGQGPILLRDLSGRTLWSAKNAWVRQMPSQGFGKDAENREWVLDTDALNGQAGGNT